MNAHPHRKQLGITLAAALALGATAAFAATPAPRDPDAEAPIVLAQATPSPAAMVAAASAAAYPPLQAGVRRAAAEGPEALRRYVFRTRMIYNWYIVDFVPQQ